MQKIKNLIVLGGITIATTGFMGLSCSTLLADTLVINDTKQFYNEYKPQKGMSKSQVRSKYGEPMQTFTPVGQPPITRWKFPEFTVYFEHNHVIHAVDNNRVRRP